MAKKTRKRSTRSRPRGAASSTSSTSSTQRDTGPARTSSRQAHKAEARKARAAYRRRAARARTLRRAGAVVALGVGVAVVVVLLTGSAAGTATRKVSPSKLPGMQRTDPSRWTSGALDLKPRLQKMGLSPLGTEGGRLHADQQLDVFVHGKAIQIPAAIGIGPGFDNVKSTTSPQDFISILHTHDTSGTVHVEAPDSRVYTLGLFFDVWGVYFTDSCIGGLCNDGQGRLRVYSDGKLVADPVKLGFSHTPHSQTVVVTYGTDSELPNPIPGS